MELYTPNMFSYFPYLIYTSFLVTDDDDDGGMGFLSYFLSGGRHAILGTYFKDGHSSWECGTFVWRGVRRRPRGWHADI